MEESSKTTVLEVVPKKAIRKRRTREEIELAKKKEELQKRKDIPSISLSIKSEKKKVDLDYLRDRDRELVKGIFKNFEEPGGTMRFNIRLHKGDKVEKYELEDGQIYTIPLGVARHLKKNCWYPVHAQRQDSKGMVSQYIGQKVHRCSFHILDTIDLEELSSESGHIELIPSMLY
jgi:hypothetical protein